MSHQHLYESNASSNNLTDLVHICIELNGKKITMGRSEGWRAIELRWLILVNRGKRRTDLAQKKWLLLIRLVLALNFIGLTLLRIQIKLSGLPA
jgi:hypothetical protein